MTLALFDLDHTLIEGDSDQLWGDFLLAEGLVTLDYQVKKNRFYADYVAGTLDYTAFIEFVLGHLTRQSINEWEQLRQHFAHRYLRPVMRTKAIERVAHHRAQAHSLVLITATNLFIAKAAADAFGFTHVLASVPETSGAFFTGKMLGTPCFAQGKVTHFRDFLAQQAIDKARPFYFYSDSHNDLPLLSKANHPVAISPDPKLLHIAQQRGWPVEDWR